jgi:glycosyltransferase involved in cell wall biosynthesis
VIVRTNISRARDALVYARTYGFGALLRIAKRKLIKRTLHSVQGKTDVLGFYEFVRQGEVSCSLERNDFDEKTVNWVIPPFGKGSGGHLNIFRFVRQLEILGFVCRIVIVGSPMPVSAEFAANQIKKDFFDLKAAVYLGMDSAPPANVTIATGWQTAYYVRAFGRTRHRCYFVQDFEPWFYAAGSEAAFAENTYDFGFVGITAGNWLATKLNQDYGMKTYPVSFSYDRELYKPHLRRKPEIRRVFFYARPPTQRRAFELGLLVLDEVVRRLPDVKVVFAGWDVSNYEIPFECLNAGLVSLEALADLYSQCDAALVLSFSNLSLLPLELMACGTPVISNSGPWVEWLLTRENAKLAKPTVEALAAAVVEVLDSKSEQERLRAAGLRTAAATNWTSEAEKLGDVLGRLDQ